MAVSERNLKGGGSAPGPISGKDCNPPSGCIACVRASALGMELSDEELHTLCNAVDVHNLGEGETLITEGDQDDRLYVIASGKMEIFRGGDAGHKVVLKSLGPGEITGELGFIEGLPRTASVQAAEESCVVSLRRHQLESLIPEHPWLVYKLMRSVVRSAHAKVRDLDIAFADFMRYVSG